jgi:membrane protein YdbS with pleckstrin-like domain
MGFPGKLLTPGEEVVVDVRPHWRFLARAVLAAVLALAASVAVLVASTPRWAQLAVGALLVLCLVWLAGRWLRWTTTSIVVTNARLVVRRGVLRRTGREILLERLTDISYDRSLLDRLTGAGDLLLESAGKDSPEVLSDLPHPLRIRNEISRLAEQRRTAGTGSGAPAAGPSRPWRPESADELDPPSAEGPLPAVTAVPGNIADQLAQLDELRRRKVITRREFAAKKAELLSRL